MAWGDLVRTMSYKFDGAGRAARPDGRKRRGSEASDFSYNALGQFDSIVLQTKPSSTWNEVATSTYGYDSLHRLTSLDRTHGATDINKYFWTYDRLNDAIPGLADVLAVSTGANAIVEALAQGDAVVAGDLSASVPPEWWFDPHRSAPRRFAATRTNSSTDVNSAEGATTFSYDANGNRTILGYSTGTNNQLLDSGADSYDDDDEGIGRIPRATKVTTSAVNV